MVYVCSDVCRVELCSVCVVELCSVCGVELCGVCGVELCSVCGVELCGVCGVELRGSFEATDSLPVDGVGISVCRQNPSVCADGAHQCV